MELLQIAILCLLASTKVTLQGAFAKKHITTSSDGIFFNGLIFFASALIFLPNAMQCNWTTAMYGMVFGVLTVVFQLNYIKAMSCGNVSLTVLIVNMSMILPIAVSVLLFDGVLDALRIVGIVLICITLGLNVNIHDKAKNFKKWIFFSGLAFLANGSLVICQQFFSATDYATETGAFVAWGYITATVISAVLYLIMHFKKQGVTYPLKLSVFGTALCIGVVLGIFQNLNTKAVAAIDNTLLIPTYNGGSLILTTLAGALLLKDKLTKRQILSLITGFAALIIMNL